MKQEAFRSLFPEPDYAEMTARLRRPTGRVDAILDTDTYNEIDDQFALAYLLRSEESVRLGQLQPLPFTGTQKRGSAAPKTPATAWKKAITKSARCFG